MHKSSLQTHLLWSKVAGRQRHDNIFQTNYIELKSGGQNIVTMPPPNGGMCGRLNAAVCEASQGELLFFHNSRVYIRSVHSLFAPVTRQQGRNFCAPAAADRPSRRLVCVLRASRRLCFRRRLNGEGSCVYPGAPGTRGRPTTAGDLDLHCGRPAPCRAERRWPNSPQTESGRISDCPVDCCSVSGRAYERPDSGDSRKCLFLLMK